tara:strand:- start:1258 stop:1800 length:543 start_codon:yes stop_codon:yes gene_type:complete
MRVGVYPACVAFSEGDVKLSGSILAKALMIGDDETIRAHLPDDVDIEDFKAIVNISDNAPTLQEVIFSLIEEVIEENKYAICTTSIGKTAGTTKRSEWSDAAEKRYEKCKDDLEESEELEEISSVGGGSVAGGSEIGSEKKCDAGYSMHADGECKKDVTTTGVISEIKGIKITYRRQNAN